MHWQQMWKQLKIIQLWIQKYQLQQHVVSWAWLNPSTSAIAAMSVVTGACNSSRSLNPKSRSCEKCKRLVRTNKRLKRKIKTLKQNVEELKIVSDA